MHAWFLNGKTLTCLNTVASSVTNTVSVLISPNPTNELYKITVTCTTHPDSTADQCVVVAMADGGMNNSTGMYIHMHTMI